MGYLQITWQKIRLIASTTAPQPTNLVSLFLFFFAHLPNCWIWQHPQLNVAAIARGATCGSYTKKNFGGPKVSAKNRHSTWKWSAMFGFWECIHHCLMLQNSSECLAPPVLCRSPWWCNQYSKCPKGWRLFWDQFLWIQWWGVCLEMVDANFSLKKDRVFWGLRRKAYISYQYSRTRRWRKFQKGKIYNAEEHVAIESFVTTLIHWTFFSDDANKVGICWLCRSGQLHVTPSSRWSLPRCHRSVRNDMRLFLRTKQYPVQLRTTKYYSRRYYSSTTKY